MSERTTSLLPGTRLMIALMLLLIGMGFWSALDRTARVDDSIVDGEAGGDPPLAWPDMRIDVNRANAAELSVLPGLGERLAQRIIEDRQRNGPFPTIDDLHRVNGIGPAIIDRIRPYVVAMPE